MKTKLIIFVIFVTLTYSSCYVRFDSSRDVERAFQIGGEPDTVVIYKYLDNEERQDTIRYKGSSKGL